MSSEIVQINADKIAAMTGFSSEEIAVVKASVAKGVTDTELAYFLNVCKSVGLNPFIKEAWAYKDHKGNLLVFAGRDGFLKKAQESPSYNGMRSMYVRESDKFMLDVANNRIEHVPTMDNSKIIGAYAIVFRKGGEPTIEWADMNTYKKNGAVWQSHPEEMIKKVAECHALKKAFGINGIVSEYDFEIQNGIAVAQALPAVDELEDLLTKRLNEIRLADNESGESALEMIREKKAVGELTVEFLRNLEII